MVAGHWVSSRDMTPTARMRLFCLPHAGSGAAAFYRWKRLMPAGIDLCPVFLPGREMRLSEQPYEDASALIADLEFALQPYLDRPYAFFGHSMGALLAFELAQAFRPEHLFVSGRIATHLPWPHRHIHALPDEELVSELGRRYGGNPQALLDDPALGEIFLPILRADLAVVESYRFRHDRTLVCPVTAYTGEADLSVSETGLSAWRQRTNGAFRSQRFAGDHFYHLGPGGEAMVGDMTKSLEASGL
ncbi:medium-chain acyl-[acyl-carrier-protein] hydrolase [Granulicella rosea]|uniref:Medium-chain acyl-[acyl-carrier-protein] hydrolase n=1 Tax=Granulicella rosea TaxID=474952 RepID=A0A239ESR7_9BACT|nr:thioesterase domain-containing protein [Granulicella rosea]SNS47677.1 medium-chain acyl-[acyl-carrier-protein] hydrolase [Granulicella rosea]